MLALVGAAIVASSPATARDCAAPLPIEITGWHLEKKRIDVPSGHVWRVEPAQVSFRLLCGITRGTITASLWRHDRYGSGGKVRFRWNPVHEADAFINLAGKPAGFGFTLHVGGTACIGVANWHIKVHGSAGETTVLPAYEIEPDTTYEPDYGGQRLDCRH